MTTASISSCILARSTASMLASPLTVIDEGRLMSWAKLLPHPGFVLVDDDGAHRAYINARPGPAVIVSWKE